MEIKTPGRRRGSKNYTREFRATVVAQGLLLASASEACYRESHSSGGAWPMPSRIAMPSPLKTPSVHAVGP